MPTPTKQKHERARVSNETRKRALGIAPRTREGRVEIRLDRSVGALRRGSTPLPAAIGVGLECVIAYAAARALLGIARQQVDRLAIDLGHGAAALT